MSEHTMESTGAVIRRLAKVGTLGLVACGVCCAGPLLALIAGGAAASGIGWLTEGVVGAAIAGMLALAGGVWFWRHRQSCRVPACNVPGDASQNRKR